MSDVMAGATPLLTETCMAISKGLDEPMRGTAPADIGVLVVEDPGPWEPKVPAGSTTITKPVVEWLTATVRELPIRLQLVRRPGRGGRRARPEGRRVMLAHCGTDSPWLETLDLTDDRDLTDLPVERIVDPSPPGIGISDQGPHLLVCAHGRRDQCCAVAGLALVRALAGARGPDVVWETSHLGGHRFAPNLLVLPSGLLYGRVPLDPGAEDLQLILDGEVPAHLLRGRLGSEPFSQAAEIELRMRLGRTDPRAIESLDVDVRGDTATATAAVGRRTYRLQLRRHLPGPQRKLSCVTDTLDDPGAIVVDEFTHA